MASGGQWLGISWSPWRGGRGVPPHPLPMHPTEERVRGGGERSIGADRFKQQFIPPPTANRCSILFNDRSITYGSWLNRRRLAGNRSRWQSADHRRQLPATRRRWGRHPTAVVDRNPRRSQCRPRGPISAPPSTGQAPAAAPTPPRAPAPSRPPGPPDTCPCCCLQERSRSPHACAALEPKAGVHWRGWPGALGGLGPVLSVRGGEACAPAHRFCSEAGGRMAVHHRRTHPPPDQRDHRASWETTKSPRREVVRPSAGTYVVYPPFLGVIRVVYPKA